MSSIMALASICCPRWVGESTALSSGLQPRTYFDAKTAWSVQVCPFYWTFCSFLIPLRSEKPYFDGTLLATDADVYHFVEDVRSKMKTQSSVYIIAISTTVLLQRYYLYWPYLRKLAFFMLECMPRPIQPSVRCYTVFIKLIEIVFISVLQ